MKLKSLRLHPFAGTIDRQLIFSDSLNVIHGKNEAGKSSILNALKLALLTPTQLSKTEFKNVVEKYIPIGGDTIIIDLIFEVDRIEYELTKTWGGTFSSRLKVDGQNILTEAQIVQDKLNELLNLNEYTVNEILFTTQTKIAKTIDEIRGSNEIGSSLDQILRSTALNTGGIEPSSLRTQLEEQLNSLIQNWNLENNAPFIGQRNKGGYSNRWEKGLGEILKLDYKLYDKRVELNNRIEFDDTLSQTINQINTFSASISEDQSFIDSNKLVINSLSERDKLKERFSLLKPKCDSLKKDFQNWSLTEKSIPNDEDKLKKEKEQLDEINVELEIAGRVKDMPAKQSRLNSIRELKNELDQAASDLAAQISIPEKEFISAKEANDLKQTLLQKLSALESAQKFSVDLISKKNISVGIQTNNGSFETLTLDENTAKTIFVDKEFVYESSEVRIHVKSLTDEISQVKNEITNNDIQLDGLLILNDVEDFPSLENRYQKYNQSLAKYKECKKSYEHTIANDIYEDLEKECKDLQSLPKTRDIELLEKLKDSKINDIAKINANIGQQKSSLAEFESKFENTEKLWKSIIESDQLLQTTQLEIDNLPQLPADINIEDLKKKYQSAIENIEANMKKLSPAMTRRIQLLATEQDLSAGELRDQAELLQKQCDQKIEEANTIKKVLQKLDEILIRFSQTPYQLYEANLSDYLRILSGGKYQIKANEILLPNTITNSTSNIDLPVNLLSQGTSGILGLAIRLTMADYFLEGKNGFLNLDDPMVDFDEDRQKFAADCFKEYANKKQLFIFTCHQSHANQLGGTQININ